MLFVQLFFDNQWTTKDIQGNMSVDTKIKDKQKIIKKSKFLPIESIYYYSHENIISYLCVINYSEMVMTAWIFDRMEFKFESILLLFNICEFCC
jgi:hypothetical protein